jgi:hypothetical protein
MKKLLLPLVIAALVSITGCASYKPIPQNYTGPIATVSDSGMTEDGSKAQIFALTAIDGRSIQDSFLTTRQASYGKGATIQLKVTERLIPAQAMKVKLRGSHITGMPIHEITSRAMGTFFEVEGVVDFAPQADKRYRVVGTLSKSDSAVWIEDEVTRQPVTSKVSVQK